MNYANPSKLMRAQAWVKLNGKEGDEAAIKARYIELGGLIISEEDDTEPVEVTKVVKGRKTKADDADEE